MSHLPRPARDPGWSRAGWSLPLVAAALVVAVTWARCPGCLDRARLNDACVWTGDTAFPVDPGNATQQPHLVLDAQLAEDLAVRYADASHERMYGTRGHGGLIDHGRLVRACMARLVTIIETTHAVTAQDVEAARPVRNRAYDAGVWLSFGLLYGLATVTAVRWLESHFAASGWSVWLAVTALASVAVSFLGLQLGSMWTMAGEIVRLDNGHFGTFRATRAPWMQHLGAVFVGGVIAFWIVALVRHRAAPQHEMSGVAAAEGMRLR